MHKISLSEVCHRKEMFKNLQQNLKFTCISVLIVWAASERIPCGAAHSSVQKASPLKVGFISLSTAEGSWTKTKEFDAGMQSAHEIREQINKIAPEHASPCAFEAPNGVYESICKTCMSLPKKTLEQLARLEQQEAIQLGNAKAIRLAAVRQAAERVRRKEHLDLIVDREAGVVAWPDKLLAKPDPEYNDFTDEVLQEIKQRQGK